MTNRIEIANITRRLLSDEVHLVRGTRVVLLASLDDQRKVNLFFDVYEADASRLYATYEVDTVMETWELPRPTGNKQQWERVRKLMEQNGKLSADDAWLQVAISNATRKWKFSMEEESGSAFSFSITVPGRRMPLEARVERGTFFFYNE